jgi:hypothetical protein
MMERSLVARETPFRLSYGPECGQPRATDNFSETSFRPSCGGQRVNYISLSYLALKILRSLTMTHQ